MDSGIKKYSLLANYDKLLFQHLHSKFAIIVNMTRNNFVMIQITTWSKIDQIYAY
jgi:hypothetical protein